ncbi:MAG: hypothetical protein CVV09_20770 [Gammaproteobacteria bacterium HGW-Gammaproteobacteria-13]|nr:MAG: hypothetical protein CVV09_20770 [Gammaproteobacteria bacterium HGW-Gammaproteobacteria-13]
MIRYLVAVAATVLAMSAWAEDDVYPCVKMYQGVPGQLTYYFVCGDVAHSRDPKQINSALTAKVRQTYVNVNGQTMVGTFPKYLRHNCKDGMCVETVGSSNDGQFSGNAPDGSYYVQVDYYLSPAANGEAAAYRTGTGPLFGGAATAPANSGLTGKACYEQKLAAFHQENGEEAMVIMDQINEWQEQCGLPPSY